MQIIDLAEQTRLLGQMSPALDALHREVQRTRDGEIIAPVREIAPVALRVQRLATQCIEQLHTLSTSQYAAMKDGHPNLAQLAGACAQVSLAATLCALAINSRTEVLLYEDADPTPASSRDNLRRAADELDSAATTYRALARRLSRRLASAAARREDRQLIERALADPGAASPTAARAAATTGVPTASSPAPKRR
ncbi:hypothetical protein [Streptomyces hokutonensis]|uniref:hypothetical protein n=1 Tax=Streptomyces hokutonensis TaxID=1306990 RepID=UPI00382F6E40